MCEIAKRGDGAQSFQAVLQIAIDHGDLNERGQQRLQQEIDQYLIDLVQLVQLHRSSIIAVKTFRQYRKSLYFLLDHALPKHDKLAYVCNTPIYEQAREGLRKVQAIVSEIGLLLEKCKALRLPFDNERYNSIFDEQLPAFLQKYNPELRGYDCLEDFDYPLLDGLAMDHEMYGKQGCDMVLEYVHRFLIELMILAPWKQELPELLEAYEKQTGASVTDLGCNLCEILLTQAIFVSILSNPTSLCLDEQQRSLILCRVSESPSLIVSAYDSFAQHYDSDIQAYLMYHKERFLSTILQAITLGICKERILVKPAQEYRQFTVTQSRKPVNLSILVSRLRESASEKEQAMIFKDADLALYDVLDLLDQDVLYEEEVRLFFHTMPDMMLGILFHYLNQDSYCFHQRPSLSQAWIKTLPILAPWQGLFYEKLCEKSKHELDRLTSLLNHMEIQYE